MCGSFNVPQSECLNSAQYALPIVLLSKLIVPQIFGFSRLLCSIQHLYEGPFLINNRQRQMQTLDRDKSRVYKKGKLLHKRGTQGCSMHHCRVATIFFSNRDDGTTEPCELSPGLGDGIC